MGANHDRASVPDDRASETDLLSEVLASIRLSGAMLFLVDASAPWMTWAPPAEAFRQAVLPRSQHLISYHVVTAGRCWAGLRGHRPERFEAGDVLVVPHGNAYFLAEPADAGPAYGADEAIDFFRRMAAGHLAPTVTAGSGGGERAEFICGFLGCHVRPFNPVLAALPPLLHLRAAAPAGDRLRPLVEFALAEMRGRSAGGRDVLARLAELMFVEVVRQHFESLAGSERGWLAGLKQPLVARAIALLHAEPAHGWTIDELAQRVGSSRSVLAERFTHFVGEPPMRYLTHWRMQLASRLLAQPTPMKLAAVAEAVGYESEAAFSRAFKRLCGESPATFRKRHTTAAGPPAAI
jgi:AraC-like DNA-binding protein